MPIQQEQESSAPRSPTDDAIEALTRFLPSAEPVKIPLCRGLTLEFGAESGRRVQITAADGDPLIEIMITDQGPVVTLRQARIHIEATEHLQMSAHTVTVAAHDVLTLRAGTVHERVDGDRETHVGGVDRIEAAAIEAQASAGDVVLKAERRISIDATSIGLNDDPCPAPFPWTDRSKGLCE